ncbi:MAG: hypothetical protein ACR2NN_16085 [Bryobacteraceae bacterium]
MDRLYPRQDLRHALRLFVKSPVFTLAAVLSLAIRLFDSRSATGVDLDLRIFQNEPKFGGVVRFVLHFMELGDLGGIGNLRALGLLAAVLQIQELLQGGLEAAGEALPVAAGHSSSCILPESWRAAVEAE